MPKNAVDRGWGGGAHRFSVWDRDGGHHSYAGSPERGYARTNGEPACYIRELGKEVDKMWKRLTPKQRKQMKELMRGFAKRASLVQAEHP